MPKKIIKLTQNKYTHPSFEEKKKHWNLSQIGSKIVKVDSGEIQFHQRNARGTLRNPKQYWNLPAKGSPIYALFNVSYCYFHMLLLRRSNALRKHWKHQMECAARASVKKKEYFQFCYELCNVSRLSLCQRTQCNTFPPRPIPGSRLGSTNGSLGSPLALIHGLLGPTKFPPARSANSRYRRGRRRKQNVRKWSWFISFIK